MNRVIILLLATFLTPNVYATDVEAGIIAYQKGEYKTAFEIFEPLAISGDPFAQSELGTMYDEGNGVEQDPYQAAKWYRKAADQGAANAQYNLGVMYSQGRGVKQDYQESHKLYVKAGDQGVAPALFNLGVMYVNSEGVKQDITMAKKLFANQRGRNQRGQSN